jgi:hypothetical protein
MVHRHKLPKSSSVINILVRRPKAITCLVAASALLPLESSAHLAMAGTLPSRPAARCISTEADSLRRIRASRLLSAQEFAALVNLQTREEKCREWTRLTPEQQAQEIAKRRQLALAHFRLILAEEARMVASAGKDELPRPGPIDTEDPTFYGKETYAMVDSWLSYVDGHAIYSTGAYLRRNPNQGVVLLYIDGVSQPHASYLTPAASGPVRILSEVAGVLTLQSLAGKYDQTWEDDEPTGSVQTRGGTIFHFNIKTRQFQ